MAHVRDRWWNVVYEGKKRKKVKTKRFGKGKRWNARWVDIDGRERSKSFEKKGDADDHIDEVKKDIKAGTYIDPDAGKMDVSVFAKKWLVGLNGDPSTREHIKRSMNKHVIPYFSGKAFETVAPGTLRTWLGELELGESAKSVLFVYVNSMFEAALDDKLIRTNPCQAKSLQKPRPPQRRIKPWTRTQLDAVHNNLAPRYRAMVPVGAGCGHRIGEVFGISVDDIGWKNEEIEIRRQVKIVNSKRVFAPPKRNSVRTVPLPRFTAKALHEHMEQFPPVEVTLPWLEPTGDLVTAKLIFTNQRTNAIHRSTFMTEPGGWKKGVANVAFEPEQDTGTHSWRHYFAAMYLEYSGNIRALADFLGHKDPGFTLRFYGHLMPNSRSRARKILDGAWYGERAIDGPR